MRAPNTVARGSAAVDSKAYIEKQTIAHTNISTAAKYERSTTRILTFLSHCEMRLPRRTTDQMNEDKLKQIHS